MAAHTLFAVGTLLTWAGYVAALRALYLLLKRESFPTALAAIAAGMMLFAGSVITASKGFHIPLIWFVMPFSAWALVVSVLFTTVRLYQGSISIEPISKTSRLKAAAIWLACAVVFGWLYRIDPDASIQIIKGSIPLSPGMALALVLLAAGSVAIMVATARATSAREITKTLVLHLTLVAGSVLFGIPFAWLVITSFKEDVDMSSPNGIVWVPRVTETVPYMSKTDPAYATTFEGQEVRGRIIERKPDGSVKLDINRPMSMRGMAVETHMSALKQVPTDVPLVTVKMDGTIVRGKVIEEMADGHELVEADDGRRQVYAPSDVTPVRKVGLRVQNYPDALDYLPAEARGGVAYVQNTLLIVVLGMIGTILSSAIVAYAFSRMRFPGRNVLFSLMLGTMMLPGAVTKLPQFMVFKQFGWIDTLYPLWVPAFFGSAFNIFMLRQFFRQIPGELEDAAKIDGAGYFGTFWRVMLPQIKPAIAVIAILTFVGTWNNFLDPLIYINSPAHMTISYAVQLFSSERLSEPGLLTAFTTMSMLPVLALFFVAQRYFIEGVTLTGLGGR